MHICIHLRVPPWRSSSNPAVHGWFVSDQHAAVFAVRQDPSISNQIARTYRQTDVYICVCANIHIYVDIMIPPRTGAST